MPSFATLYALHQLPYSSSESRPEEEAAKEEENGQTKKIENENSGGISAGAGEPEEATTLEKMALAIEQSQADGDGAPFMYLDPIRRMQLIYQEEHVNSFYPDPMHRDMTQLLGEISISENRKHLIQSHLGKKLQRMSESVSAPTDVVSSSLPTNVESGKREEAPSEERPVFVKESLDELEGRSCLFNINVGSHVTIKTSSKRSKSRNTSAFCSLKSSLLSIKRRRRYRNRQKRKRNK